MDRHVARIEFIDGGEHHLWQQRLAAEQRLQPPILRHLRLTIAKIELLHWALTSSLATTALLAPLSALYILDTVSIDNVYAHASGLGPCA